MTVTTEQIIAHRREKIRETAFQTLTDRRWLAARNSTTVRAAGGIIGLRPLMLAKTALFDEGALLLDYWPLIERERRIPWDVHAANMALTSWGTAGTQMHSNFFSTKTEGFDEIEIGLHGGKWIAVSHESDMPGFGIVSEEETLEFIAITGGQHPEVDHPILDFDCNPKKVTMPAGQRSSVTLTPELEFEFPVTFTPPATGSLDWASVSEYGELTLDPPAGQAEGFYTQPVIATDAMGTEINFDFIVEIAQT